MTLPDRFYSWRKSQYDAEQPPSVLFLAPLALIGAVGVTWYATLVHNVACGWVVTAFVTTAAVLGAMNLFRWRQHRGRAIRAVGSPTTRRGVDLALVGIGTGFVLLALTVY